MPRIGRGRVARALLIAVATVGLVPAGAWGADPPTPWDGEKPFHCNTRRAGLESAPRHTGDDPYCVHFRKTRQNLTALGIVEFLALEPARVAAAVDKCFYFQTDHWKGALVQGDDTTQTYEWRGHYFFDKARGEGGVWVSGFSVNGQTFDPTSLPGFPAEYKPFFGPGEGGVITHNSIPAVPECIEKAKRKGRRLYRHLKDEEDKGAKAGRRREGAGERRRNRTRKATRSQPLVRVLAPDSALAITR